MLARLSTTETAFQMRDHVCPNGVRLRPMNPCVIVGGGFAGMVAARRLQQIGVRATVLEKGDVDGGLGNAVISGGLLHIAWEPPDSPADVKRERLLAETSGEIDDELAGALASQSGNIIPWLQAEGVEMRAKTEEPATRWTLWPFRVGTGRRLLPDLGPSKAMQRLYERFREWRGDLRMGAAAHSLHRLSGGWQVGFQTEAGEASLEAGTVLFADGGFQANQEMLSRYVGPNAGLCLLRASTTGTGDGLRMLLENGAEAVGLGRVYGHLVSINALESDELWPFPHLDELCMVGVVVTRHGDRVPVDTSAVGLVTRMARSEDPRGFAVVFDEEIWNGEPGRGKLGLPAAHNTVRGACPVSRPPFHAARVIPGITFTMGGAKIGPDAAVRAPGGRAIPGLFAAGSTAGGIQGGPNGGYVGGLATAATFGYIAAESIAAYVQSAAKSARSRASPGQPDGG
ncbi:MAG: FAD-dependent oxidoreductase [Chloroflexi bacterium]|nr:MAG: FAD-dependent oxidoreductase [Chloroflexota bacterium]